MKRRKEIIDEDEESENNWTKNLKLKIVKGNSINQKKKSNKKKEK